MNHSMRIGFSFGLTSGIITTLGLMIGLYAGTGSEIAVMGGIITIAIADAFSDAMGIHVSEESENEHTQKEVWESTLSTFLTKFSFALTFVVPMLFFPLSTAVLADVIWGLSILSVLSYSIARREKKTAWKVILEHIIIAVAVIVVTHFVGLWVSVAFA